MRVCVQGLWHLGTVTAACLASLGHVVVGLDADARVIANLRQGIAPLFEPGLEDLLKKGLASGQLVFSDDPQTALKDIEVLWVTYDTPVDDDDNADVEFVIGQIESVLPHLPVGATVLISSQLAVGSVRHLESVAATRCPERRLGFAYSPENLRLGKALDVFLKPDRIIAGARRAEDRERLQRLLASISERVEWMSVESAEMTKHAINAFLATSVTFANEIASICELVGADAKEVERGLKSESRIGPKAYLSPGAAFAGGTLARDIRFLSEVGAQKELVTPLLSSVKPSNDAHKKWVRRRLKAEFPELGQVVATVWGLTYKPGTDTLRRSAAVELCDWLLSMGAHVRVHDPAVRTLPAAWAGKVQRYDDPLAAVTGAQVLIIATEWPLYRELRLDKLTGSLTVIDANRFLPNFAGRDGVKYIAVGTPQQIG